MKQKLFNLLKDSVYQYGAGAGNIMNTAINTSIELLCEVENLEETAIREQVHELLELVCDAANYYFTDKAKSDFYYDVVELKIMKLQQDIDNGKYNKEVAANE